jgi:hypothetical protein
MPIHTDLSLSGDDPSRQQRGLDWASGRDSGIKMDADIGCRAVYEAEPVSRYL